MDTEEKLDRIVLVGPTSPPIGGIATYVEQLAEFLRKRRGSCHVLDPYPAPNKYSKPEVGIEVFSGVFRYLRLFWRICRAQEEVLHFHFSTISLRFLCLSAMLPRRRRRLMVTFHNGDLYVRFASVCPPFRYLVAALIARYDKVIALSSEQQQFLESLLRAKTLIERWDTPPPGNMEPDFSLLPQDLSNLRAIEDGGGFSIIVTSGYPASSYCFEFVLELAEALRSTVPIKVVVCLYGQPSKPDYERQLLSKLKAARDVIVIDALPPKGFLALLRLASVYLRPTTIDSFGLSVRDALDQGTPCVASDVCARDPRSYLFKTGDFNSFMAVASQVIISGHFNRRRMIPDIPMPELKTIEKSYRFERS
jgi:glycogen(starch) synthase